VGNRLSPRKWDCPLRPVRGQVHVFGFRLLHESSLLAEKWTSPPPARERLPPAKADGTTERACYFAGLCTQKRKAHHISSATKTGTVPRERPSFFDTPGKAAPNEKLRSTVDLVLDNPDDIGRKEG